MDKMERVFIEEARGLVNRMRSLLHAAAEGPGNPLPGELFQRAHALKGASLTMELHASNPKTALLAKISSSLAELFRTVQGQEPVMTSDSVSPLLDAIEACGELVEGRDVSGSNAIVERLVAYHEAAGKAVT